MRKPRLDLTGKVYQRWTVVKRAYSIDKTPLWHCRCSCGTRKKVRQDNLRNGLTRSCGCLRREVTIARNTSHNLTNDPLYTTWKGIKDRCYYVKAHNYGRYGAKGVKMYRPWKTSFALFHTYITKHLGRKPSKKHTLDRIDGSKGYYPKNLRWATASQQSTNRTYEKNKNRLRN